MREKNATLNSFQLNLLVVSGSLVGFVILGVILRELARLLQPLFVAVFFYYVGAPLSRALRRKKVPDILAQTAPIFVAIAILTLLGWIIGAHMGELAEKFPSYKLKLQGMIQGGMHYIFTHVPVIGENLERVYSSQVIPLAPLEGIIRAVVGNFVSFLSTSLLVIFFLIFINSEAMTLPKRLEEAYGMDRAKNILAIGRRINGGIIEYVYVKGLASLLVSLLSTMTMLFFRLDLAILWGTLIFFGNFIPYLGSIFAVAFPVAIAFLQFDSFAAVSVLTALLIGFQILVSNFVEPKYTGQQLNLSPLVVLISLVFWGWLWGIIGLLLSIPIMVSIKFVLENIPATHDVAILMSHTPKKTGK